MTDLLQILLSLPGWFGLAGCLLVVFLAAQALKIVSKTLSLLRLCVHTARTWIIQMNMKRMALYTLCAACLMPVKPQAVTALEWVENNWIDPVYVTPADTSAWALSRYEAALEKNLSPGEAETVKRRTRETAARVGSTPLAIYEVAYSECGLNPFCIRKDGIAAGWIQFTAVGLQGLGVSLERVKQACRNRETGLIMDLTEAYLVQASAGRPLPTSTDIYTAIFAPSFVGREGSAVLYSGWNRPSYFLNAGLDGHKYRVKRLPDGREKLVWYRSPDGAITINDLRWALAAKRAMFLKSDTSI